MTAERKKWWRKVALASVGGTVAVGGLFGIVRATVPPDVKPAAPSAPVASDAAWTRAPASAPAPLPPAVSAIERAPAHTGDVVPAGAVLPLPLPPLPTAPVPAAPTEPVRNAGGPPVPVPPAIEPVGAGPRAPDAGLLSTEKIPLPPVPTLPPVELPKVPAVPAAPAGPDLKPQVPSLPAPAALPALPAAAAEPPKAPALPAPPAGLPALPITPSGTQPAGTAPPSLPAKSPETVQPMVPAKPDSGLKPTNPQNTLNPPSPAAPAVPIGFPPTSPGGREVPGTPVDRPKPPEPAFGATEKFVFPLPTGSNPLVVTPRDPAMFNFKHAAAAAILGGAMLTAEQARSAALPNAPMAPAAPAAEDKDTTDKLKKDLEAANKKIEALEKQVARLTELLLGKKDDSGYVIPSDPGAVAEINRLKDQIKDLDKQLGTLKTQTVQKPAIVPEVKPKGIVRVVNEYPVEISMVINDKSHRVAPNQSLDVEVPAGNFAYQLLQSGAPATRSVIKDKETVTLRIK